MGQGALELNDEPNRLRVERSYGPPQPGMSGPILGALFNNRGSGGNLILISVCVLPICTPPPPQHKTSFDVIVKNSIRFI